MFILPAFHPAHVLRKNRKLDGLGRFDLRRAVRLREGWRPAKPKSASALGVDSIPPAKQVAAAIRSLIGSRVAADIETDGKHPLVCDVRCLGLWNGERGVCITFLHRDGSTIDVPVGKKGRVKKVPAWKRAYSVTDEGVIIAALNELFDSVRSAPWSGEPSGHDGVTTLYGWNFQFDSLCLRARLNVRARYTFDGIVAHHVLLPYWPHTLAFVTSVYTDFVYYKKSDKGFAWSTKSDYELRFYCVTDCISTWLTCEQLIPELKEREGAIDVALNDHDHRYVRECEDWRETGVLVDTDVLAILREHYSKVRDRALARMQEVARGVRADAESASKALDALAAEADGDDVDGDATVDADPFDDDEDDSPFAPASLPQLRSLLTAIGVPLAHTTETGVASTAKEFLLEARKELLDCGAKATDLRIAFLDYLFAWREAGKVVSTFLKPELINGRLHSSFSVHVVPSGRVSSKNSNFMNQPKEIRCMFVAPDGHKIVAGDWDAAEMRIVAYIASELALISAFDAFDAGKGPKVHRVNTNAIFGIPLEGMDTEDPKIAPLYRTAKAIFFLIAYGGGPHTAYETARKEMPDLSWEAFSICFDRLKAKYPILFRWQKEHVANVAVKHYIDSTINHRRMWFFEPIMDMDCDEAAATLNFPIQSAASDIVSKANIRVLDRAVVPMRSKLKAGEAIRQLAQIHDELLFETPDRLCIALRDAFKSIAEEQPDATHPWRLPVDAKIVKRWAHVDVNLLLLKEGEKDDNGSAVPCLLERALAAQPKLKAACRVALGVIMGDKWKVPPWLKGGKSVSASVAHAQLTGVLGADVTHAALRTLGRLIVEVQEEAELKAGAKKK